MKTLEMIKDWQDSGFRKKYVAKNDGYCYPHTVYNNGCGVLFESSFIIGINKNIKDSKPFYLSERNIDVEWVEVVEEYTTAVAYKLHEEGNTMISLVSSERIRETLNKNEILGKWIIKY